MEKECSKCGEVKPCSQFSKSKSSKDGRQTRCKKCNKAYREANKDKIKLSNKAYYQVNKDKINAQQKAYQETNKNNIKAHKKAYYEANKDKIKAYQETNKDKINARRRAYRKANKVKVRAQEKAYREANKVKVRKRIKAYQRNRRKTDFLFRLRNNLTKRVSCVIKNQGYTKKSRTHEMLGIDYERLVIYLERQFKKGMTWDNYGEWHIDHIIPLSSAKTEQELLKLCHYTNLQPLWAVDNLTKNNKIEETQILLRI